VFASYPDGRPYGALPRLWRTVAAQAEREAIAQAEQGPESGPVLAGVTLHSLRHSFAGIAEELGASLPTIAALLGHRLGGVTAGYVLKRVDRPLVAFADRVASHIAAKMHGAPADNVVALPAAR
jgi:integrase